MVDLILSYFLLLLLLISAFTGFLIFGLTNLICFPITPLFQTDILNRYGPTSDGISKIVTVRGKLYNIGSYMKYGFHRDTNGMLMGYTNELLNDLKMGGNAC